MQLTELIIYNCASWFYFLVVERECRNHQIIRNWGEWGESNQKQGFLKIPVILKYVVI